MNRNVRIVYNGMFKNEAGIITRMLESVYKYIDYYVIQDNGSTDGTPDIIKKFFEEKNIPGVVYYEPWVNFGYNRNHTLQKCLSLNSTHNCEYILRVDADETLEVDDDFDWEIIRQKDAWNIYCNYNNWTVYRMWLWKSSLPWEFTEFSRHETIQLKDEQSYTSADLPQSFRHIYKGGGATWSNVYKYAIDGLELEKDQLNWFRKKNKADAYHFYYTARSYAYHIGDGSVKIDYPYPEYENEIARRCIWFYEKFLDVYFPGHEKGGIVFNDRWVFEAYYTSSTMHLKLGEVDKFLKKALKAYAHGPDRNEPILEVIKYYTNINELYIALKYCYFIIDNNYTDQQDARPVNYSNVNWQMPEKMLRLAYATNNVPGIKYASQKIRNASYWFDVPPEIKDLVLKGL
jgi:glycosyltransferase involved in cell wall biosynthesis